MSSRRYNFGAGPATLPESILLEAQAELLNWQGQGMSILEIGHRTAAFQSLMHALEADLRDLLAIPEHFDVLFLGGAARTQFAMVPMNLMADGQTAGYLVSGIWSRLAYDEACQLKSAYCLASSEEYAYRQAPKITDLSIRDQTAYVYYTPNETINGVRFAGTPKTGSIPLIADMTSCLLSEPIDVSDFGLIFAGAQKNIAPAGLTVVIIRRDLMKAITQSAIPTMLNYRTHSQHHSLYATPPMFNCYMAAKMFKWVKAQGGVASLHQVNRKKAEKLYDYIDSSQAFECPVEQASRSWMNVCFSLNKPEREDEFLARAAHSGLHALKGHRLVGGLRASLYNAMPMSGVDALIAFMQDFSK
ncbi:MAG TPA: 3-phosphoserine/phosphohydroxythreonine transaminase [Legionella sp.]|nr:3-phosphoserine/phosphohydroxythreonine transaminase [Legionella sp.]